MVLPLIIGWLITGGTSALVGLLGAGLITIGFAWLFKTLILPTVVVVAAAAIGVYLMYLTMKRMATTGEFKPELFVMGLVFLGIMLAAPMWVNGLLSGLNIAPMQSIAAFSVADTSTAATANNSPQFIDSALSPYVVAAGIFGAFIFLLYAYKNTAKGRRKR